MRGKPYASGMTIPTHATARAGWACVSLTLRKSAAVLGESLSAHHKEPRDRTEEPVGGFSCLVAPLLVMAGGATGAQVSYIHPVAGSSPARPTTHRSTTTQCPCLIHRRWRLD